MKRPPFRLYWRRLVVHAILATMSTWGVAAAIDEHPFLPYLCLAFWGMFSYTEWAWTGNSGTWTQGDEP